MKKFGAIATAVAVAATTFTTAPAFAQESTPNATIYCLRTIGTKDPSVGQKKSLVPVKFDAPEKVTAGEEFTIDYTPAFPESVQKKSAYQAQGIAKVKQNTQNNPYDGDPVDTRFTDRSVSLTFEGDDAPTKIDVADSEWHNGADVFLDLNHKLSTKRTAGAAGSTVKITKAEVTFKEQVKISEDNIQDVSVWNCDIVPTGDSLLSVDVEEAKDTTPPATQPGVGSSLGGLLPLLALILSICAAFKHLFNFNGLFGSR